MSPPENLSARERLIVALDLPSADAAARMAERLRGRVGMFKVGLELFTAEGPVLAHYLIAQGEKVFLDLKFHDIPNTARAAAREAAQLGASMLNVHALGGRKMMEAAREGVLEACSGTARPRLLAVTLLTSHASQDLAQLGIAGNPEDVVLRLALLAHQAQLDGVVASGQEVRRIRSACGSRFLVVTPGIRPASSLAGDQARTATPEAAIRAGPDFLVVGRPITEAPDPQAATESIVAEIQQALTGSSAKGISGP